MKKIIKQTLSASALSLAVSTSVFAACSADIDMGGKKITNTVMSDALGTSSEVANKNYVDSLIGGGASFMKDGEGNVYATKKFGSQIWTLRNMRTEKAPGGGAIQDGNTGTWADGKWAKGSDTASAPFATQDDSRENQNKYGYYYTWTAAMNGATAEGSQGICASGWHIPTDAEWNTLETTLGGDGSQDGATGWRYKDGDSGKTGNNAPVGDNMKASTGFNAVLAGYRDTSGAMAYRASGAIFWSSSQSGASAFRRNLHSTKSGVDRNANNKAYGFSVRCLKD